MPRPHDRRCPHLASPRFERSPVLSSSYRNRLARPVEEEEPPPPEHDLQVTGTLTPDVTGFYDEAGTYNTKPYYTSEDTAYYIWWRTWGIPPTPTWFISIGLNDIAGPYWNKQISPYEPPPGNYNPWGGAVGTATVAEA